MATLEFTTEKCSEEKVINWKIKNFAKIQETKALKDGTTDLKFSAGESLGQPSIWRLEMTFTKENEIGIILHLEKSYESGKGVHAWFWGAVQGQGPSSKLFAFNTVDIKEYTASNGGGCSVGSSWGWDEFVTLDELKISGSLINDTLTLQVKIIIYGEDVVKNTTATCTRKMLKDNSLNQMSNHFKELLKTGDCSDFVIRVKDLDSNEYVEKKVHRNILSSQSPVFGAMMGTQMSEKETGFVTIEDLTPKGLDVFLEFVYTGDLPDTWKRVPEEIVNAAEKYNLPLLKTYCDEWLHTVCTPDNVFNLLNLAKRLGLSKASVHISEYIKSNLDNVLNTI